MVRRRAGETMETGVEAARLAAIDAATTLIRYVQEAGPSRDEPFNEWMYDTEEFRNFEAAVKRLCELSTPD